MAGNSIGTFNAARDDYDADDGPCCDVCGCELEWDDCSQCSGEGYFDEYEYDAINYAPGEEFTPCCLCLGTGGGWYCPNHSYHATLEAERANAQE